MNKKETLKSMDKYVSEMIGTIQMNDRRIVKILLAIEEGIRYLVEKSEESNDN